MSFWLAEMGVKRIFGERWIAPSPPEALTFELLLVLGSAVQCFVLGIAVQSILQMLNRDRREPDTSRSRPA